jgi:hypothetical protein
MDVIVKVRASTTTTYTVELDENQISQAVAAWVNKICEGDIPLVGSQDVEFFASQGGYLESATVKVNKYEGDG